MNRQTVESIGNPAATVVCRDCGLGDVHWEMREIRKADRRNGRTIPAIWLCDDCYWGDEGN